MTEKINTKQLKQVSTDTNLGTSDVLLPTQNAVKQYVDKHAPQVTTMPTAGADYFGRVLQYIGATSASYTHGYVYECVSHSETQNLILFNPVGIGKLSFNYNDHDVMELFERIAALSTPTFDPADVATGSFKLDKVNELWYIDGYDSDNNALFTNFTVSGTGDEYSLDAFGFVYTFPFPDDYEEGHEEGFSIAQETVTTYSWSRIDIQPLTTIIDDVTSTSTTAALSANQGKVLQDQINDVKGRGRFLSIWNCATGLAETNPPESPYAYKSGDYFLVGTVDSTTNYKPNGSSYVTGVASTTVETSEVKSNDEYIYDGTSWKLQANSQREYTFSGIAGSPYDNTNLSNALDSKVDETSTANQVYGTDGNGDQTTVAYGTSNTGSALVQRSAAGQVQVPNTPTAPTHATSKKYVDDGLDEKVDKVTTKTVVYGTTGSGGQTTLSYGAAVADLILVRRPVGGYISVPETPTDDAHATSKKYVDTALSAKQNSLTAGTNITISGSTISAKDTTYTAGENITIESTGAEDYTLLEYIQSNGSQYIDTGVSGLDSGNWIIYVKWMQTAAPTTSYSYIAGAYNSESHNAYRIITKQTAANGYYVNGNSAAGNGSVLADNYAANVVHQGYIRNGSVTIDSTTYTTSTQGTAIPSGVHMFLLGSSNLGKTSCKLYESWATQNGVEKYHFYPAIRNSDSAVGMYDTVGQRFITGTGTFAAGPVKSDGFIIKGKSWSLADLTDTVISSPSDGQSLIYDANTSKWKNVSATVSISFAAITGSPEDNTALANALDAKSGCILRRW